MCEQERVAGCVVEPFPLHFGASGSSSIKNGRGGGCAWVLSLPPVGGRKAGRCVMCRSDRWHARAVSDPWLGKQRSDPPPGWATSHILMSPFPCL